MGFELSLVSEEGRLSYVSENYDFNNLVYMGDSDADAILEKAFIGIAPINARKKALEVFDFAITKSPGGSGAVAEACDWIEEKALKENK